MTPTQPAILAFLREHSTLTLATRGPDGQPMAASLFFAAGDDLRLYWVSGDSSRHSRNLARDPRAAITVHAHTWDWGDIMGVQMEGEVGVVPPGPPWQAAWDLYRAKFVFVDQFQAEITRSNFYVFTPRWARFINNALGFGHRDELEFSL
jgi:uncharacterized protein YhbP (UPF0306 family)